jgi:GWxTD domain-containing protein
MRRWVLFVSIAAFSNAASPAWLDLVAPIISPTERKTYLLLNGEERAKFEEAFWSGKAITATEYNNRVQYIDAQFGSGKLGSGANTDQGRVYLALGPPNRITRVPSSRTFQPIEIWYYTAVPGVLNTEVALMFFQKNGVGVFKLYSPVRDTIRALLLPQASNVHLFGPNDDLNESQIRENLQPPPGEDEVISAAVHISASVRYEENDAILGKISSPSYMLGRAPTAEVTSRFILSHPKLDVFETPSPYGGSQVDLGLEVAVRKQLDMEVLQGESTIDQNRLNLKFPDPSTIRYTHRLDLLPGVYRLIFNIDGKHFAYNLDVSERPEIGEIMRADERDLTANHPLTPFSFDGTQFDLRPDGKVAILSLPRPEKVVWTIRRGTEIVWRATSEGAAIAAVTLPTSLTPGSYTIEANAPEASRRSGLEIRQANPAAPATVLSFNANLAPASRLAFVGYQWILRGRLEEARKSLTASLERDATEEAQVELARLDALDGKLDQAREEVRRVLVVHPDSFEALSVFAYIETRFQDYSVAADLYRRALAVQDSSALRAALAEVDRQRQDK